MHHPTFKYQNHIFSHMDQPACGEVLDTLWKSALVGVAAYFVYRWAIKEGVTSGHIGSRSVKYLSGKVRSWAA
jgi:hypothetical protein